MEIFILELEGIWQFGILEAQNSEFFFFQDSFLSSSSTLSLSLSLSLYFYDQQLAFENNEIKFQNN